MQRNRHTSFPSIAVALLLGVAWPASVWGQAVEQKAGEKNPDSARASGAETDYQEFAQLRRQTTNKDEAGRLKLIAAGLGFLTRHAASNRAVEVVNALAFQAGGFDLKRPGLQADYVAQLKAELAVARRAGEQDEPTRAAWLAVAAALADQEVRAAYNADNLAAFRRELDALAAAPASGRFLVERERSYVHVLSVGVSLAEAATHLQKLLAHRDPAVAAMARVELNLVELKQAPIDLKFTAMDGRPVDLVRLRGRVVMLYVWSTGHRGTAGSFEAVRKLYEEHRRRGLEVVSICVDPADHRNKVAAVVRERQIPWPVHFDGQGLKHPLLEKLNLSGAPALLLLDQKGFLQHAMVGTHLAVSLPYNQVVAHTRRLLVIR